MGLLSWSNDRAENLQQWLARGEGGVVREQGTKVSLGDW